jgi:glutamate formiminotransferase / 5-formyltetrahydrofolate cyclo-ligase
VRLDYHPDMVKVLEAVPNFSEGRDLSKIQALVDVISGAGVDVLDWSADPDHHRCVVTYVGDPRVVARASVEAAKFARDHIDLRGHVGVHPRVGALDVMPFVPLQGMEMSDAVTVAHAVGDEIAELGVPVFFYGAASTPPGRGLADLRRGGFEALAGGFRAGFPPDTPGDVRVPHASAGVTCVGAREVLLAWNVFVSGLRVEQARAIARLIREQNGGFPGLRALGLHLARQDRVQISMNLEDPERTAPLDVYRAIEREVAACGARVQETQVIGMIPDTLVLPARAGRLQLPDLKPARVLSLRLHQHTQDRLSTGTQTPDDL